MRILALTWKNVIHHGMAVGFALLLFGCMLFTAWVLQLSESRPSLMDAATGLVYYVGPLFVLFLNDRLVARDWADQTSEFLMALPMGGLLRLGVPFMVGLFTIAAAAEMVVLSTAVLASRREGLALGWMLVLHAQVGAYLLAWHAMAFGIAHTGRYRWLVWWCLFVFTVSLESGWIDRPFRTFLWHAPLADPVQQARSVVPWDAFPIALAWTVGGLVLAGILGSWRGGALSARWFRAADSRSRSSLLVGGVIALMLGALMDEMAPSRDAWRSLEPLEARIADVRVAGARVEPIGERVVEVLDGLGAELGVESWPRVVLYPSGRGLGRHVRRVDGDAGVVLLVDPEGPVERRVQDVVSAVLEARMGYLEDTVEGLEPWVRGASGWLVPDAALPLRRALASSEDGVEAWRLDGEDVGRAVMASQLATLEAMEGREAVLCGLRTALGRERSSHFVGWARLRLALRGDWLRSACGVALPDAAPAPVGPDPIPLPPVEIVREGDALFARLGWAAPQQAVLRKVPMDPLEDHAPRKLVRPRLVAAGAKTDMQLDIPPTESAAIELVLYWPAVDGWLSSGTIARRGTP